MERFLAPLGRWLLAPVVLILIAIGIYHLMRRLGWKQRQATGLAMVSPWIVGFIVFTAYPIIDSLYLSFTKFDLFSKPQWIGFQNFTRIFTQDVYFWPSVRLTVLYAVLSVPIGVLGSILVATLLNRKLQGMGIFRTLFYLPAILPEAAVALLWRWLFNGESGLINFAVGPIFALFGSSKPDWFGDPRFVLPAFIIVSLWGVFGTNTVIFLASLQGIPRSLYEVSDMDGASAYQKFRYVTVPQISPVILLQVVNGMIAALQIFTVAQFLRPTTAAGQFLNQLVYTRGFTQLHMGEASAVAWVLFVITLVMTLLVFRSSPAWVHYEAEVKK